MVDSINAEPRRPAGEPPFSWKTIPQGAATSVWAGVVARRRRGRRPLLRGLPRRRARRARRRAPSAAASAPYALDPERAKALWAKSEEMVGERF